MAGEISAEDLKEGMKFIVGKWEVDFLVNPLSHNLDHLPATDFKTTSGKDMSKITWEFFEDHTLKLKNGATGEEESGTWEQTSSSKFKYKCEKFFGLLPPEVVDRISVVEKDISGGLVFTLLVVVRLKKTAEGQVTETKKPDIGDVKPSADDQKMKAIVGRWKVYKSMGCVGGDFGMFTRAEVEADQKQKIAKGEGSEEEAKMALMSFDTMIEFTDDHVANMYAPIPPDVSKEEIDEAVASGEVKLVDGMILDEDSASEWKFADGEYWYNTKEKREVFGEPVSPWDKITPDAEGHMKFRMLILERK